MARLLRRMAARVVGGFDRRRGVIGSGGISRTRGRRGKFDVWGFGSDVYRMVLLN